MRNMKKLRCLPALFLLVCLLFCRALAAWDGPGVVLPDRPDFSSLSRQGTWILYGEPDTPGRCTAAVALLGPGMKQPAERADISEMRPTGLHNASYSFIRDRWVWNRCHLIGRQLGGADGLNNLFTGTHELNTVSMLAWENRVAETIRKTGKRVFYRATPQYTGNDLVCSCVLLEALSADDNGRALCFTVLLPNEEPGVAIDYATGYTTRADDWETGGTGVSPKRYILNKKSGKFHLPDCPDAASIGKRNRAERKAHRGELLKEGYTPCGKCRP